MDYTLAMVKCFSSSNYVFQELAQCTIAGILCKAPQLDEAKVCITYKMFFPLKKIIFFYKIYMFSNVRCFKIHNKFGNFFYK